MNDEGVYRTAPAIQSVLKKTCFWQLGKTPEGQDLHAISKIKKRHNFINILSTLLLKTVISTTLLNLKSCFKDMLLTSAWLGIG